MKKFTFILIGVLMACKLAQCQTKEQARAQRFVKHQHLLVQAIREIVEDDPERYCKDLSTADCKQAKDDQAEMMKIIHRVADHDSGQGAF